MNFSVDSCALVASFWMAATLCAQTPPASLNGGDGQLSAVHPGAKQIDVATRGAVARQEESAIPPDLATGFQGHFSTRTFSGLNRELAAAVSDQNVARMKQLLDAGADINARSESSHTRGMTILQTAVWHRWGDECVRLLIESGADLEARDAVGDTALVYACSSGPDVDADAVKSLLRGGARVDVRGAVGMTPLMHAAMQDNSLQVVEALLAAGADVQCQDDRGWTALMHCTRCRRENVQLTKRLIAAGANVNATHKHGGTALLNAAYHGRSQVVQSLIAAGANVNVADEAGWTPLIAAAMNGHTQVVRSLLQAGADAAAVDRLGRTPLVLAKLYRHTATGELLVEAGATH